MAENEVIQRAELQRKIWNIADALRGSVDGWDFNLGIIFLWKLALE